MSAVSVYTRCRLLIRQRLIRLFQLQSLQGRTYQICARSFINKELLRAATIVVNQQKWKSKKQKETDSDSEEEDEETIKDDEFETKGVRELTIHSASLRIDAIAKAGFGLSRNKAEEAVYNSEIRVNNEKVLKKGTQIYIGDTIDLIRGVNPENDKFIDVSRLIIKKILIRDGKGRNAITVDRFRSLTIENYADKWVNREE